MTITMSQVIQGLSRETSHTMVSQGTSLTAVEQTGVSPFYSGKGLFNLFKDWSAPNI